MKLAQKLAIGYLRIKLKLLTVFSARLAAESAFEIFCTPLRRVNRQPAAVFATAEKTTLLVDGKNVVAYQWNKQGRRKIMVLHGFESASNNFAAYITAFIKKGYSVVAADAPAHGSSDGKQITLPLYIKTIDLVCAQFGPMDGYLAHSFGGLALMHYLESIEHDATVRVALIAPATETVSSIDILFDFLHLNKAVRLAFDHIILQKAGKPADYYSIPRASASVRATILWVHDENDEITPIRDLQPLMASNPANIEFMVTQQLGHRKIYRDATVMQKVIDFL
jgi:predicted alpha/beta hydrolase family esterase